MKQIGLRLVIVFLIFFCDYHPSIAQEDKQFEE